MAKGQRDVNKIIPANSSVDVAASGTFVYLKSSSADVVIDVDQGGAQVEMEAGDKYQSDKEFKGFHVVNETGSDITAVFVVGYGDFTKSSVVGTVSLGQPTTLTSIADVTVVAAAAAAIVSVAASSKRSTMLRNLNTNAVTLRIGGSTTAAAVGLNLAPGEQLTIEGNAAIYAYAPAGANEQLSIVEIHD